MIPNHERWQDIKRLVGEGFAERQAAREAQRQAQYERYRQPHDEAYEAAEREVRRKTHTYNK